MEGVTKEQEDFFDCKFKALIHVVVFYLYRRIVRITGDQPVRVSRLLLLHDCVNKCTPRKRFGSMTRATIMRLVLFVCYFLEMDNAYMQWFERVRKMYNKKLKQEGYE